MLDKLGVSAMTSDVPFPDSLCHQCVHLRVIRSGRGSTFLLCQEPSLPRYGPQPVRTCRGLKSPARESDT